MKIVTINRDRIPVADAISTGGDQCESCGSWKQVPRAGYRGWWTQEQIDPQTGQVTHWIQTGYRYGRKPSESRGYLYCTGCGASYRITED